ncbi:hypothetical protein [Lignipirellula cremea]|uniref:Uncharacterized protein n=1 Tax=Lignipirellula cremea TaxID=2528010 RepID=A0A518E3I1_9BACT|nr:hypothetical protein [Lignipirellula cremea]QDU98647.1 hypothetical protein Pla8534_65190 [Lignipirellula cremea]
MSDFRPASDQGFVDRRNYDGASQSGRERRQFANTHSDLAPEVREVATAIDEYKLVHRRRFITYEEMLTVFKGLGYRKAQSDEASPGDLHS